VSPHAQFEAKRDLKIYLVDAHASMHEVRPRRHPTHVPVPASP